VREPTRTRRRPAVHAEVVSVAQPAQFFSAASKQLASSLDYEATLCSVARLAVPTLADGCAVDIVEDDGCVQRMATAHVDPTREQLSWELAQRYPPAFTARGEAHEVIRTRRSVLEHDITDTRLASQARDADHLRLLRQLGSISTMIVPLVARDRTLGALSFAMADSGRRYHDADLVLAEEYAEWAALAIDNARMYRLAQGAIQVRDTYLATVAHDLKNPLATISGQAQLLRRIAGRHGGPLAARVTDGLLRIDIMVARMSALLDELLDIARLEQGHHLELRRSSVDIAAMARRKVADYQHVANQHLLRVAGETELVGNWDAPRLERVLDNLIANAIKYSPDGGLITIVVVCDEDDEGGSAIVSVRDEGLGIPAGDLTRIFEGFQRAHNALRIDGTGLGLAVSRQIVEQHGGSIVVDSVEGHGSTFTVRLPLQPGCS
jgi:signal transduction histidine kinase